MTVFVSIRVDLPPEEWVECLHCGGRGCDDEHCDRGLVKTAIRRVSESAARTARRARGRGED